MGLYVNPRSPFWWMLLEGTGRQRESTGIPRDAGTAEQRRKNRAAAEAIYHARMTQLARARVGLPYDSGVTFDRFADWFEVHHIAKHRGAKIELLTMRRLRAAFGPLPLRAVSPLKWKEYETRRMMQDGVAVNTLRRELAIVKTLLSTAVPEHLDVSPLAGYRMRKEAVPPKRTLTAADEAKFLDALARRDTPVLAEIRDLYLVGVGTLLREGNLVHLRRREHHDGRLIVATKTGPHQVPLTGPTDLQRRAAAVLRERMPASLEGHFFPLWHTRFAKNRESASTCFLETVRRAIVRAGLPWGLWQHGVVWHTMTRASGATRMLRDYGVDVRTVQLIGGWKSLDQMAEYLGVDNVYAAGPVSAQKAADQPTVEVQDGSDNRATTLGHTHKKVKRPFGSHSLQTASQVNESSPNNIAKTATPFCISDADRANGS